MAVSLDEIDVRLLKELEVDADRPTSSWRGSSGSLPPPRCNRVRRLKESGVIRRIAARLDSAAAGFALQVYVMVTLARHDEAAERRFFAEVRALENVISADSVAGETDAMLMIVARDVAELQVVLSRLSTRGGAQRLITLLRLAELKPASPLPLRATSVQRDAQAAKRGRGRVDTHEHGDPSQRRRPDDPGQRLGRSAQRCSPRRQAQPSTPAAQADVILALSTAAAALPSHRARG